MIRHSKFFFSRVLLSALAAILFLDACGKKAPLRPPGSERPPTDEPTDEDPEEIFERDR